MSVLCPYCVLTPHSSALLLSLLHLSGLLPFFEADQIFLLPLDATQASYEGSLPPALQLSSLIASSLSRVSRAEPSEGPPGASGALGVSGVTLEELGLDETKEGFEGREGGALSAPRMRMSDKADRTFETDGVRPLDDIKR